MKGSSLSMSKIYSNDKIEVLKRRIDFISTRRKKNWISIEPSNTHYHTENTYRAKPQKNASQESIHNEEPSRGSLSKTRSIELMDLRTKRYQECK